MTDQPQGRSMHELRAILQAEDERRTRLMNAWADLLESEQVALVDYAEKLAWGLHPGVEVG